MRECNNKDRQIKNILYKKQITDYANYKRNTKIMPLILGGLGGLRFPPNKAEVLQYLGKWKIQQNSDGQCEIVDQKGKIDKKPENGKCFQGTNVDNNYGIGTNDIGSLMGYTVKLKLEYNTSVASAGQWGATDENGRRYDVYSSGAGFRIAYPLTATTSATHVFMPDNITLVQGDIYELDITFSTELDTQPTVLINGDTTTITAGINVSQSVSRSHFYIHTIGASWSASTTPNPTYAGNAKVGDIRIFSPNGDLVHSWHCDEDSGTIAYDSIAQKYSNESFPNGDMADFNNGLADGYILYRGNTLKETVDVDGGINAQYLSNPVSNDAAMGISVPTVAGRTYNLSFSYKKVKGSGGSIRAIGNTYFPIATVSNDEYVTQESTFVSDGSDLTLRAYAVANTVSDTNAILFTNLVLNGFEINPQNVTLHNTVPETYFAEDIRFRSYQNEFGYSEDVSGAKIPIALNADGAPTKLDAFGNTPTYLGRTKNNIRIGQNSVGVFDGVDDFVSVDNIPVSTHDLIITLRAKSLPTGFVDDQTLTIVNTQQVLRINEVGGTLKIGGYINATSWYPFEAPTDGEFHTYTFMFKDGALSFTLDDTTEVFPGTISEASDVISYLFSGFASRYFGCIADYLRIETPDKKYCWNFAEGADGIVYDVEEGISGDDKVSNGDFSQGDTDWEVQGDSISFANGQLIADGGLLTGRIFQTVPVSTGTTYRVYFDFEENTLNGNGFGLSAAGSFVSTTTYPIQEAGLQFVDVIADGPELALLNSGTNTSGQAILNSISIIELDTIIEPVDLALTNVDLDPVSPTYFWKQDDNASCLNILNGFSGIAKYNGTTSFSRYSHSGLGAGTFYYKYQGTVENVGNASASVFSDGGASIGGKRFTIGCYGGSLRFDVDDNVSNAATPVIPVAEFDTGDYIIATIERDEANLVTWEFINVTKDLTYTGSSVIDKDYSTDQPLVIGAYYSANDGDIETNMEIDFDCLEIGTTKDNIIHRYQGTDVLEDEMRDNNATSYADIIRKYIPARLSNGKPTGLDVLDNQLTNPAVKGHNGAESELLNYTVPELYTADQQIEPSYMYGKELISDRYLKQPKEWALIPSTRLVVCNGFNFINSQNGDSAFQYGILTVGNTYVVCAIVTELTGSFRFRLGSTGVTPAITSTGIYCFELEAAGTTNFQIEARTTLTNGKIELVSVKDKNDFESDYLDYINRSYDVYDAQSYHIYFSNAEMKNWTKHTVYKSPQSGDTLDKANKFFDNPFLGDEKAQILLDENDEELLL